MSDTGRIPLLGLSGSLRQGSYSTCVLETVRERCAERADLCLFDLAPIPAYNHDFEGENRPPPVKALNAAIAASAGLVIVSPEFNHGLPGILKNALDWVSRPAFGSVVKDKPVAIMTCAPGALGGVRAQSQLRETLASMLARIVVCPEVIIAHVAHRIRDGRLVDATTLQFTDGAIEALLREIGWWRAIAERRI
jgi:chromate reductase